MIASLREILPKLPQKQGSTAGLIQWLRRMVARRATALIGPNPAGVGLLQGKGSGEDAWPGVKVGRCDESALWDHAAFWPAPSQDYWAASVSCRRMSGSCGRTAAPGFESRAVEDCPEP